MCCACDEWLVSNLFRNFRRVVNTVHLKPDDQSQANAVDGAIDDAVHVMVPLGQTVQTNREKSGSSEQWILMCLEMSFPKFNWE